MQGFVGIILESCKSAARGDSLGLCINDIHIRYTITYMNYLHVHHAHTCVCVIHTQIWISLRQRRHPLPQNPIPLAAPRSWPKRKLRRWTCQTSPVVELTFFKTSKMGWIEPNRLNPWAIDWMRANHRFDLVQKRVWVFEVSNISSKR